MRVPQSLDEVLAMGAFSVLCCSLGVVAFLFFTIIFIRQRVMLRKFSGPFALPLIGNCHDPDALMLMKYLSKLRKRYGNMFTFWAFTKPYLVVCDPAVVRRILSDTKTFCKGSDYTYQFAVAFGEGLVTSNGDKHRKDRAHFGKYFTKMNVNNYMGMFNVKATAAIEQMLMDTDNHACDPHSAKKGHTNDSVTSSKGRVVNVEHFFALLALRVFMQFAIGHDFGGEADKEKEEWLAKAVSDGSWAVGRMITLGLPMWNIFPSVKTIRTGREVLWDEMKKILYKRQEEMAAGGASDKDDCLTVMINEKLPEQEINDHLVTLLSAGHDTTAYFSAYMCYLLAQHPEVQDKLREEIKRVMGGRTDVTADDVTEMKYLLMVMQETLRLYSIIPCVTRACTTETHIKETGVTIPKGSNIMIPMFLINRDPELWDDAAVFKPERFEGSTGYFTSSKAGFFPFGYGSRTCIGNTLAQLESAVFLCHVVMRFQIQEDIGFKPAIFAGISLTTSNGINVRLKQLD